MQPRFIFLSILLIYSSFLYAQNDKAVNKEIRKALGNNYCDSCPRSGVIYYDFECKEFYKYDNNSFTEISPKEFGVRYNKKLKLQVINVNRYVYDVGILADDISFGSDPPTVFNQLFLGSGDFMTGLIEGLSLFDTDSLQKDDPIGEFLTALTVLKAYLDNLQETQIEIYTICKGDIPCCNDKEDLKGAFTAVSSMLFEVKKHYLKVANEFTKKITELNKKINDSQEALNKLNASLKEARDKLEKEPNAGRKKELEKLITEIEQKTVAPKKENEDAKLSLKLVEESKGNVEKLFSNFSKITDEELMKLILFNNNYLKQHFYYQTPPIYPQGNRLNLQMGISARDSSLVKKWNINPIYNDSISFSLPVIGKSFLYFSAGPFLGLSSKTRNEIAAVQAQPVAGVVTDSAQYKIVSAGNSSKPLGLAGLATYGIRLGRWGGAGISAGVGVSIEPKPRPNYLAGISLFAGDLKQFTITFGWNFVQVDRFNSEMYPDLETTFFDTKPEIEYRRKSEVGCFLSLTYTVFTPSSSKNIKSTANK